MIPKAIPTNAAANSFFIITRSIPASATHIKHLCAENQPVMDGTEFLNFNKQKG